MFQQDDNEGLVPHGRGLANPMYGDVPHQWWEASGVEVMTSSAFDQTFMPVANGMRTRGISLSLSSLGDNFKAFCNCSPLQAVVTRTAEALMNGVWKIKDKKTTEDVSHTISRHSKIITLLNSPNPMQSHSELLKQLYIYLRVYGGVYLYAAMPSGFTNIEDAISLWVFSPEEVDPVYTGRVFSATSVKDIVSKYKITATTAFAPKQGTFDAEPHQMLAFYDTAEIDFLRGGAIKGQRIKSLYYEIRNIMQAQEAVYSLNSDRGMQGIITNTSKDSLGFVPMSLTEKDALQNRFRSSYGMRRDQAKIYVTDASVDYKPVGFNVKDLMLFEGVRENIMHVCDTMNYPFDLLASEKGKTAADKRTSMTVLYQDNIIPTSNEISAKLARWVGLDEKIYSIEISYDHLPIMQTGNVEKNNALRQLTQAMHIAYNGETITRQEFRRTIGLTAEINENETMRSETAAQSSRDDIRTTQA